ncbi:MAG: hypothetical protein COB23_07715 [Methylophaga sp.]|nr:MAG: hypothetical protein COB23_07715 [Methylophaga sp.]
MKKVVFIVLLAAVITAGYFFINKADEEVSAVPESTNTSTDTSPAVEADDNTSAPADSMITPVDMSEEAQTEMYNTINDYNQCMMKNRLEYHQQGIKVANVADKTLAACEPHLDSLAEVLLRNNVNEGLSKKMVHTMRSRAARRLMSAVMQSMAGQAAAMANAQPETVTAE